ncbi:nucleotidyltransferase domain-containing protein [Nocardia camponoti]|uniref:Polymerase nucleotidyl transferase domain-containing protein n=1 Tax=Nocardia camponoti TaxID=1616106 RepID=A0A917QCB2_9NOCA|nr:nucleotidyltransferase domain-containing protein [Nocardia camponoti]GGK43654.1 hypothetical protein GCM10011591_14090 [Nocardia camponoti]
MTLTEIVAANRPDQFGLLERATAMFTASEVVTHLLVRGSLARGTADRLSDVDFVVGVDDSHFVQYASVLDALVATELSSILPGWLDTIVGDMGGLGSVYLVGWSGRLHQLDIYLAPASKIAGIRSKTLCRTIFEREPSQLYEPVADVELYIAETVARPRSATELLIEVMVLAYLIRKRITRGHKYIAYSEVGMLNTAAKNLIKTALAPRSAYYGWYQLESEVGITPIGRTCLGHLTALISLPGIPSLTSLRDALSRVFAIAEAAAPEAMAEIGDALDAYHYYLELP